MLLLTLLAILAGCAMGPGAGVEPTVPSSGAVPNADEIAIYAAVIRRIYAQDDTFGGQLQPPIVHVVRHTDDSIGAPGASQRDQRVISQVVEEGIVDALADLPAAISWVDSRDDVALEPSTDRVADGGVIVTLGNIHYQEDASALVSASIYVANLAAGGKTHVLQLVDGDWQVTGSTGVEWVS